MSCRTRLVGIGAGGHAKVLLDTLQLLGDYEIVGLLAPGPLTQHVLGVPVIGDDSLLASLYADGIKHAFIAVGDAKGNSGRRQHLTSLVEATGMHLVCIRHPSATIAASASIGTGAIVLAQAVINAEARLGANVIVNTAAVVEHDCQLADFVHIAPRACLAGGVTVGRGSFIGIGACVREGIQIGANAIVAAGAVVVKDVANNSTVLGVPARAR